MKVQKQKCYYYFVVLMIVPSIVNSLRRIIRNCKKPKLIFLQQKHNQVLTADHYFSHRKWQPLETRGNWQH